MSDSDSRKIFVGGLSLNTTQQMLSQYFGGFGAIEDAIVMTDKITGRPRGFGFVTFKDHDAVEKVLLEAHSIDGRTVECKRAVPLDQQQSANQQQSGAVLTGLAGYPGQQSVGASGPGASFQPPAGGPGYGRPGQQSLGGGGTLSQRAVQADGSMPGEDSGYNPKKIFAGGLPASCDEAKLRGYFSKYGGIVDCVVMIDRVAQRHRGFGYVTFEDPKSVDQCMAEHDSHQIDGKWIDVKRCVIQDPAQRKQQGYPTQAAGPIRRRTDGTAGYGVSDVAGAAGYYYNAPPNAAAAAGSYAAYGYGAAQGYGAAAYGAPGAAASPAGYAGAAAMYGAYGAGGRPGLYTGPAGAAGPAAGGPGGVRPTLPTGAPAGGAVQYGRAPAGPAGTGAAGGYAYNAYYAQAGSNPYYAQTAGYGNAGGYAGYGGARSGGAGETGGYYGGAAASTMGYGYGMGGAAGGAGGAKQPSSPGGASGGYGGRGGAPGGGATGPY